MKIVAICLVTAGVAIAAVIHPLLGAENPAPANKPAAAIIITNKPDLVRSPYLSAGLPEIVKMHKAGVDASVLLAFVQNSPTAYHPSAKEIIYLRDQGVSSEIISAMLRRGGELRDRATPPPAAPAAPPAPANPSPPQATAPAPTVAYDNTPYPVYTYPNYVSYPAYGYSWPAYYNYSYCRPYYYRSSCYPSYYAGYRSPWYPSVCASYRSGCYSGWGVSAGYGGGRYYGHSGGSYYGHGGGASYGHSGGYRSAAGGHGGVAYGRR